MSGSNRILPSDHPADSTIVEQPSIDDLAPPQSPLSEYRKHHGRMLADIQQQTQRWRWLSLVRGGLFLFSIGLLVAGFATAWDVRTAWFVLAGIVFIGFLYVAYVHEGLESKLKQSRIRARLLRWDIARLERDWDALEYQAVEIPRDHRAVSNDLDLFGQSSLFQLIGGVQTPLGIELAVDTICKGLPAGEIAPQQRAVDELRSQDTFRKKLRFLCHLLSASEGGPSSLLTWAETPPTVDRRGLVVWVARALSAVMFGLLILMIFGPWSLTVTGPAFLGFFAVNFMMTVFFAGRIHGMFNQVSTHHREIGHYRETFELIHRFEPKSPLLSHLHDELFGKHHDVSAATRQLGWMTWMANLRRHGILFLAYLFLQFLFLWDFHVLALLKGWRDRHGGYVRTWLSKLGHWELIGALAQLAKDHPAWSFPDVSQDVDKAEARFMGQQLGHPLLPNEARVCNDVEIGPPGSVLLVTGSNMSGKSTLLRAVGLNVVLAQMGSVVCANQCRLPPLKIETSMRIQDSLADGVSFFMAELKRLKDVVDIAAQYRDDQQRTLLFLLDEILQGTNSRERHIAVSRVVNHLIEHRAIGAVSTHDLELGKSDELGAACRAVHFRESFIQKNGRKTMIFDYRMHPGIATTTNALELLKIVGLDDG